jgi:hypothetical protein
MGMTTSRLGPISTGTPYPLATKTLFEIILVPIVSKVVGLP